ncbi:protein O-GlcNAcase-like isoform X11 [Falco peregrinus]|uniref:protein O-GlcNAcase-like isoform X11 n=1 Tax=Falco peregrinus TaxID=8954 RepID=UPI00247B14C2|nr:protein O-GlcNAcase-like isoform X11 [Falco peregrinus]
MGQGCCLKVLPCCNAGFYGRPWSTEQRKLLFQWLKRWGLNCYMYAPKDELKHRLLWREPYTEHEPACSLSSKLPKSRVWSLFLPFLRARTWCFQVPGIGSCCSKNSGRSPSSQCPCLQVAALGCHSFALLFDDIDPCMCQADRDVFPSLAQAQASVANEVYQELGQPSIFLFCPTEYCSSLCSPSPSQSCYLLTIGQELLPGIGVIWTGPKVVSQELSGSLLKEVEGVLHRRPVIWDNLYANDYDCRRVFLGPYTGRAPGLMPRLHGLLLNPNCELQANFIPMHTLGSWFRSELGSCARSDHTGTEAAAALGDSQGPQEGSYSPQEALELALHDWVVEINRQALEPGGRSPGHPSIRLKGGVRLQSGTAGGLGATPDPQPHDTVPSGEQPCSMAPGQRRRKVTSEPENGTGSRTFASSWQSPTGDGDQLATGSRASCEPSSALPSTAGSVQCTGTPVATKTLHSPGPTMCCSNGANTSQNLLIPTSDARTGGGSPPEPHSSIQPTASRADTPQTWPGPGACTSPGSQALLIDGARASPGPMAPLTPEEAGSIPMAPLTPKEARSSPTAPLTPEGAGSGPMVLLTPEEAESGPMVPLTPKEARSSPTAPPAAEEARSIPMALLTPKEARSSTTAPLTPEEAGSGPMVPLTPKEARSSTTAPLTPEEAGSGPMVPLTPKEARSSPMAPLTPKEARSSPTAPLTPEEAGSGPMVLLTPGETRSIPMTPLTLKEVRSSPVAPLTPEEARSIPTTPLTPKETRSIPMAPLTPEEARSSPTAPLTLEEVRMLVELFYLPYHHGLLAQQLLEHFRWLRANSFSVGVPSTAPDACGGTQWRNRAQSFQQLCAQTCHLHSRFVSSAGQALLYDLHPYLWDIRNMLLATSAFVLWLDGHLLCESDPKGTWGSCFGWCQSIAAPILLGGDAEPWVRRGGLFGELQALLPVGNSCDLFYHPPPLFPASQPYLLRPLLPLDKGELYRMCRESLDCDPKVAEILAAHPDLLGDRLLGSFLSLSPEYTFVLEDEAGPCGYAAGTLCAEGFLQQRDSSWLPAIRHKYPRDLGMGASALGQDTLEEALLFFNAEPPAVPLPVLQRFPSLVQLGMAPRVLDVGVSCSLAICLLSALRANGSRGVFCQVSDTDRQQLSFYSRLGFVALPVAWGSSPGTRLLGRLL